MEMPTKNQQKLSAQHRMAREHATSTWVDFYICLTIHTSFCVMLRSMKTVNWLTGFCFLCVAATAISHPSSGIVVNERGEVFFVHSGRGLAKLDQTGKLTYVYQSKGGHWLCLDPNGSFSRTQPKYFER